MESEIYSYDELIEYINSIKNDKLETYIPGYAFMYGNNIIAKYKEKCEYEGEEYEGKESDEQDAFFYWARNYEWSKYNGIKKEFIKLLYSYFF